MSALENEPGRGLIIAAPATGSGKTVLTLALLHHFQRAGLSVAGFKVGPDYIDPGYLAAASRRAAPNLDPWAMRPATIQALAADLFARAELVIGEGVMGLFDGAADGTGSTADLANALGLPIVLVVDAAGHGASLAALVQGFLRYRKRPLIRALILNRVGSTNHERLLRRALAPLNVPILGIVPRDPGLLLPSRHLGLVQASEQKGLDALLKHAADLVAGQLDLAAFEALAAPLRRAPKGRRKAPAAAAPLPLPLPPKHAGIQIPTLLPPLGQRIAIARDEAFGFLYAALLEGWRQAGAELSFFSPLADQAPAESADAVFLPGGYPELHAGRLAGASRFLIGLVLAARRGTVLYGECGGYMTLGEALIDAEGRTHRMAGLLPLETSFAKRRLHLGYRTVSLRGTTPLGRAGARFKGHEFHYAVTVREGGKDAQPMFDLTDAEGQALGQSGLIRGHVAGSFVHLVDRA